MQRNGGFFLSVLPRDKNDEKSCPQSNQRWKRFYQLLVVASRTPQSNRQNVRSQTDRRNQMMSLFNNICTMYSNKKFQVLGAFLKFMELLRLCEAVLRNYCTRRIPRYQVALETRLESACSTAASQTVPIARNAKKVKPILWESLLSTLILCAILFKQSNK